MRCLPVDILAMTRSHYAACQEWVSECQHSCHRTCHATESIPCRPSPSSECGASTRRPESGATLCWMPMRQSQAQHLTPPVNWLLHKGLQAKLSKASPQQLVCLQHTTGHRHCQNSPSLVQNLACQLTCTCASTWCLTGKPNSTSHSMCFVHQFKKPWG